MSFIHFTTNEVFKTNTYFESDAIVGQGADVNYIAGQHILLSAEFDVPVGVTFCAKIDDCGAAKILDVDKNSKKELFKETGENEN